MNQTEKTTSSKKDNLTIGIMSAIGLLLSVISFFIYNKINSFLVVIAICIADLIFSYFNAKLFFKSKDWDGARQLFIPLMMIVYWAVVFAVISIGNAVMLEGEFSNHFFLYPIFLMPSFVLVLLLLALVAIGM